MRFVVEVVTIGDGLPDFLGASCSGSAFLASVVSVSMSVVLRCAKNLRTSSELFRVTLRLPIYCQSLCLGAKPIETHDRYLFFS
jgi:hypothetical protein